jgi:hypothetical protein
MNVNNNSEFSVRVGYVYALVCFPKLTVIMFLKVFSGVVVVIGTVRYLCEVGTQFSCTIQSHFALKRPEHDSVGWPLDFQPRGLWRTKWHYDVTFFLRIIQFPHPHCQCHVTSAIY